RVRDTEVGRVTLFDRTRLHGERDVASCIRDRIEVAQILRVALGDDQGRRVHDLGVAERGFSAAVGKYRHSRADDIPSARVEAGDERVPVNLFDLDVIDAEVVEDLFVHGDGRTGRLAAFYPGVRLLGCDGERDGARLLRLLEGRHARVVAVSAAAGGTAGQEAESEGSDCSGRDAG